MTCPTCQTEELNEHRTGTVLKGYCPSCGQEHLIAEGLPRQGWKGERPRIVTVKGKQTSKKQEQQPMTKQKVVDLARARRKRA